MALHPTGDGRVREELIKSRSRKLLRRLITAHTGQELAGVRRYKPLRHVQSGPKSTLQHRSRPGRLGERHYHACKQRLPRYIAQDDEKEQNAMTNAANESAVVFVLSAVESSAIQDFARYTYTSDATFLAP